MSRRSRSSKTCSPKSLELFPSEYIHVGGDEAVKNQWHASPRVQSRMREFGVKDEHALQSYFVQRIEKYLNAHGRRLIGWDEILEGGLAPNATVMSWRGIEGAVTAAAAGHDTVLSPAPTLYLDNRPLNTARPPGRGPVVSIEDVYRFDPAPAALTDAQRQHVIGVQANLWTEHVRTEDRAEYMIFPRAAALAEVGWSPAARIDWQSFQARLPAQLARYKALGVGYAQAPESVAERPGRRTSHELTSCTKQILLSLEDDAPLQGERAVFLVDIMNPCWIYQRGRSVRYRRDRGGSRAGAIQFPDRRRREEDSVAQAAERRRRARSAHRWLRRREDRDATACAGSEELRGHGTSAGTHRPAHGRARSVFHVHAGHRRSALGRRCRAAGRPCGRCRRRSSCDRRSKPLALAGACMANLTLVSPLRGWCAPHRRNS